MGDDDGEDADIEAAANSIDLTEAARQAHEIAGIFLRLDRLAHFEALALEGAGCFSSDERAYLGDEDRDFLDWQTSQDIELALEPEPGDTWDYSVTLSFLRRHAAADDDLVALRGTWEGRTPRSPAEEKPLFRSIVAHYWPDGELTDWMVPVRRNLLQAYAASQGRLAEVAGRQSLAVLDRTIQLRSALGNQLLRSLALFEMCQRGHFTMQRMGGA